MDFLILTVYKGLIYRSSSLKKIPSDMVWRLGQPFYQRGPGCAEFVEPNLDSFIEQESSFLFLSCC